jgi:hypothetical protein
MRFLFIIRLISSMRRLPKRLRLTGIS